MRVIFWLVVGFSLIALIHCKKDGVSNQDRGKEIARIFFTDITYNMDVEEVIGNRDNRITCKLVQTLGPGIRVVVYDRLNRKFQIDFENVEDRAEFKILNGFAEYIDENGNRFETAGPALQNVEIDWYENLRICEFTYKARPNPAELRSQTHIILIDSLKIETLREDEF